MRTLPAKSRVLLLILPAVVSIGRQFAAADEPLQADFRYTHPWWQTSICLPDDWQKTLVGKEGSLLYDFPGEFNQFKTRITVDLSSPTEWARQELASPRVPIVRTWKKSGGIEIAEEAFAVAPPLEHSGEGRPPRNDVILVSISNTGPAERAVEPVVIIESQLPISIDREKQTVSIGEHSLSCSSQFGGATTSPKKWVLSLGLQALGAGKKLSFVVAVASGTPMLMKPASVEEARQLRDRAAKYWEEIGLPYDRISVPDKNIQALLDSSIRNIMQAREIKKGLPAFQVGPTHYRGLWVVDGAFILEAATYLGLVDDVRNGIEYLMTHQRPDGGFMLLDKYWKESGIVLWAVTRHAQLTGDKEWLSAQWPKLERAWGFILKLREDASKDPNALEYRLLPAGFPDGGLGGKDDPEYTNIYWTLAGMRAAIDAARWLGKTDQADGWQREYDDFMAVFRKAAERDMLTDPRGNRYLPIIIANKGNHLPQRAQWAFCHAIFPGKVFAADDPLVRGNMAMLEATERQGMVFGTGWMADGLWNYFASFYGHAWLWLGNGPKAARVLYAFANHASPLLVWCEEQSLADAEKKVKHGDMPHNWASAEFIRLVRHLLVLERGKELHLFEGLPANWTKPGDVVRLKGVLTAFGPISLELRVAEDGKTARLNLEPPSRETPERVIVHLGGWADPENLAATAEVPARGTIEWEIPLRAK